MYNDFFIHQRKKQMIDCTEFPFYSSEKPVTFKFSGHVDMIRYVMVDFIGTHIFDQFLIP